MSVVASAGSRVVGVMATLNPCAEVGARARFLVAQLDRLIVVIDASNVTKRRALGLDPDRPPDRISVLELDSNLGIAAALNAGVCHSAANAGDHLLFLDDDSDAGSDFVARLLDDVVVSGIPPERLVLGSHIVHRDAGAGTGARATDRTLRECLPDVVDTVISSGLLVTRATFDTLGGWDESLFIDGVDHDFCLRALDAGCSVRRSARATLLHRLGAGETVRFGPWQFWSSHHSALRRRYLSRNSTRLAVRHLRRHPRYAAAVLVFQFQTVLRIAVLEHDRSRKLTAFMTGWLDALRGRSGQIID